MSQRKYFGTDGIRGCVGQGVITPEFVMKLGWAVGRVLASGSFNGRSRGKVVIGKDTRISGYMFESALEAGLSAAGIDILLLGPMPTPAIAYLTSTLRAQAGIVISASHNPYQDNGIKFFSADGMKLSDEVELAIEAELEKEMHCVDSAKLGKAERVEDAAGRYIEFCKSTIPPRMSLKGLRIVVDCANGATYHVAPSVFIELGADVITIGNKPNGLNINEQCGSTAPSLLQHTVLEQHADLGVGLDGDGDRVIMVDHTGELLDGDELLFIIAMSRSETNAKPEAVVGTVMSNLGLEHALKQHGIELERAKVGDRYVMEILQQNGCVLGGEGSGHIICLDRTTTGDGVVSALQVLVAMQNSGKSLNQLKSGMTKYPQVLVNVPVSGKVDLENQPIREAVSAVELQLKDRGRVLLRPSGTEPLVRVMVEGRDAVEVEQLAEQLAEKVKQALS
ncbi:MAG: phosphoglucosamine mutase [Gammaproteobacteria bacterium]|nr:phosphoglucosamine mutase [Gammaproteobacteria bacterium]MDH5800468.1 phosphoglucosamine mutase [Gammaproteobacteria bacterium]